jgi:hypothetical protein
MQFPRSGAFKRNHGQEMNFTLKVKMNEDFGFALTLSNPCPPSYLRGILLQDEGSEEAGSATISASTLTARRLFLVHNHYVFVSTKKAQKNLALT